MSWRQKRARIVRQRNLVLIVGSGLDSVLLVAMVNSGDLKQSATEKNPMSSGVRRQVVKS
jgi:hypothetical protein